jgi:hypothetical protein
MSKLEDCITRVRYSPLRTTETKNTWNMGISPPFFHRHAGSVSVDSYNMTVHTYAHARAHAGVYCRIKIIHLYVWWVVGQTDM